jgi:septum formation protein
MRLVLASASPRRRALLEESGLAFEIAAVDVDETPQPGERPEAYVQRLARAKAHAAFAQCSDAAVLGADTAVVLDGEIFGKPLHAADAIRMLTRLSGRSHDVLTGVALKWPGGERVAIDRTEVWFKPLSASDIQQYAASAEPRDKAGAYAIQGIGGRFVERIDGSHSNVVGLPIGVVLRLLAEAGLS